MTSDNDKKKDYREISYQVGWKKGKIQWNEGASEALQAQKASDVHGVAEQKRLQLLWFPALTLPKFLLLPLLYALPIISFGLTLLLIYSLRQR